MAKKYIEVVQRMIYTEQQEVPSVQYSEQEMKYWGTLRMELNSAKDQRDQKHWQFNDQTYPEWYVSNERNANSYAKPRKNRHEVRIKTGTTEEKRNTMLSTLLNFNLEPNIKAFDDEDQEIMELGETSESLIKKSRKIEQVSWDKKRPLIYEELLNQGTVFVSEDWVEWDELEKELDPSFGWDGGVQMKKFWTEKTVRKSECRTNLIPGINVYLGDITEFFMEYQPYFFTREYMERHEFEAMFAGWPRTENVPHTVQNFGHIHNESDNVASWSLDRLPHGKVEVIRYYNKRRNEFQIICNGVMMLPIGFPLSALSGVNEYPVKKGDLEPMSENFAYSKSIPAKTKVDQEVLDEYLRLMLLKTNKSYMPPFANNTKKKLNRQVFMAGQMTNNLDGDQIKEIGTNNGVTPAEFQVFNLVKSIVDSKSVNQIIEGQLSQKGRSATEIVEVKKQAMMKLGLSIWGVVNLEKDLSWGRLHNILRYWTDPIDTRYDKVKKGIVNQYRTVSIDDTFEDGTNGEKIIKFVDEIELSPTQIAAEERILSRRKGKKVKKVYIPGPVLRTARLKWHIEITPTEKNADALEREQFTAQVAEGFKMFGPQRFQMPYVEGQWAQKNGFDYDKMFVQQQDPLMQQAINAQAGAQTAAQPPQGGSDILNALAQNPRANTVSAQQAQGNAGQPARELAQSNQ